MSDIGKNVIKFYEEPFIEGGKSISGVLYELSSLWQRDGL